jgi:hypothetical protein
VPVQEYGSENHTTRREVIVGWIILGLIAVVVAGVIVIGVRRRRAFRAQLASQPPDSWKIAQHASIAEADSQVRGQG